MNNVYIRFSTDKQDEIQQLNMIKNVLGAKGMSIDRIERDEGVSGGVSYKDRKLYSFIKSMSKGDCLVVSEISRLGRSMSDLNKMVNDELKPRGIRLIVTGMGLDLDCSNLKAIDEMVLFSFSFAAQIEKELIQDRTRSALEARRKAGIPIGGTKELWGRKTGSDRTLALDKAHEASARKKREKARLNPHNIAFREFIEDWESVKGKISRGADWEAISAKLNSRGKKTATGMEFTAIRAHAMYLNIKRIYNI